MVPVLYSVNCVLYHTLYIKALKVTEKYGIKHGFIPVSSILVMNTLFFNVYTLETVWYHILYCTVEYSAFNNKYKFTKKSKSQKVKKMGLFFKNNTQLAF